MQTTDQVVTVVAILWSLSSVPAFALESTNTYSPVQFGPEPTSVDSRFQLPQSIAGTEADLEVYCQAIIETDGLTRDAHCIAPLELESLGDAALYAINRANFQPAQLDGQRVTVLMNLMVEIKCPTAGDCSVSWMRNHGRHRDDLGKEYSAPQPVIQSDEWYKKYPEKLRWIRSSNTIDEVGGPRFLVSAMVDESGAATKSRVEAPRPPYYSHGQTTDYWGRATSRAMKKVRYIPGHHENNPIAMRHFEYWVDPDGYPLRFSRGIALSHHIHNIPASRQPVNSSQAPFTPPPYTCPKPVLSRVHPDVAFGCNRL